MLNWFTLKQLSCLSRFKRCFTGREVESKSAFKTMPFSALKRPAKNHRLLELLLFLGSLFTANLVTMSLTAKDKLAVKTFFGKVGAKAEDIGNETLSR